MVTVNGFKDHFDRDFEYGATIDDIRDKDIERAFTEATAIFNPDLYPTDAVRDLAYLYLAAHFLVEDVAAADGGGASNWLHQSRSVGSVSETIHIPERIKEGSLSFLFTTYYGQKWYQLSEPYLVGVMFTVKGATQP